MLASYNKQCKSMNNILKLKTGRWFHGESSSYENNIVVSRLHCFADIASRCLLLWIIAMCSVLSSSFSSESHLRTRRISGTFMKHQPGEDLYLEYHPLSTKMGRNNQHYTTIWRYTSRSWSMISVWICWMNFWPSSKKHRLQMRSQSCIVLLRMTLIWNKNVWPAHYFECFFVELKIRRVQKLYVYVCWDTLKTSIHDVLLFYLTKCE